MITREEWTHTVGSLLYFYLVADWILDTIRREQQNWSQYSLQPWKRTSHQQLLVPEVFVGCERSVLTAGGVRVAALGSSPPPLTPAPAPCSSQLTSPGAPQRPGLPVRAVSREVSVPQVGILSGYTEFLEWLLLHPSSACSAAASNKMFYLELVYLELVLHSSSVLVVHTFAYVCFFISIRRAVSNIFPKISTQFLNWFTAAGSCLL